MEPTVKSIKLDAFQDRGDAHPYDEACSCEACFKVENDFWKNKPKDPRHSMNIDHVVPMAKYLTDHVNARYGGLADDKNAPVQEWNGTSGHNPWSNLVGTKQGKTGPGKVLTEEEIAADQTASLLELDLHPTKK